MPVMDNQKKEEKKPLKSKKHRQEKKNNVKHDDAARIKIFETPNEHIEQLIKNEMNPHTEQKKTINVIMHSFETRKELNLVI